ncbi:MAG: hypothetical protein H0W72_09835, partial [Planctomycetes bacterium]|nr:hypothetical protein [Planctomycetota bacterium]
LYRLVAGLLAISSPLFLLIDPSGAAAAACLLGSGYLFALTPLASSGARAWIVEPDGARIDLALFFVGISIFLVAFFTTVLTAAISGGWIHGIAGVVAGGIVLVLGIGSYAVELVYVLAVAVPEAPSR